jgi:hypothetical protein
MDDAPRRRAVVCCVRHSLQQALPLVQMDLAGFLPLEWEKGEP